MGEQQNSDVSLILSHMFKTTLLHLFDESEGIIIRVDDKLKLLFPNVEKVLIFNHFGELKVIPYDGDVNVGQKINIEIEE